MFMETSSSTQEILERLNDWRKANGDVEQQQATGADIWQDVILGLPTYDEAATDDVDTGGNDRFMTSDGVEFYFDGRGGEWVAR